MIRFVETDKGLDIFFKENCIMKHTFDNPVFFLGYGKEQIENYRGNFTIDDYVEQRSALRTYEINGNTVVFHNHESSLACEFTIVENRLIINMKQTNIKDNRFWMRLYAEEEEKIFGAGEQASYFNLRGRNYPLWTSEPGVGRDKNSLTTFYADLHDKAGGDYYTTYYPETTFVSTRKYWCHVDSYAYAEFNFKHSHFHELYVWEIPNQIILSFQKNYLDIVQDLTDYVGHPLPLPDYILDGIILGVQGGMEKVKGYLSLAQEHDVEVAGLWCQDWAGYKYTTFGKRLFWNWVKNEQVYPNFEEEIKTLENQNIKFLGYVCPFLLEDQSLFNEANELGYLVLNENKEAYRADFGEFLSGIVDLTNPAAFTWFKGIIKKNLIDIGIRGWMADFGEYLPTDCVLYSGEDPKKMHNKWPVLWARCNYEVVQEANMVGKVLYFMRSAGHGSQQYTMSMWAGDQSVNWELHDGIASTIPSALSVGMTGIPFTHSDIGGYTSLYGNIRTKELFDRWLEMSVFTTMMRTHEGNRPSENFQFYHDRDTLLLMARMTKVRKMLKPYIKQLLEEGRTKGYPVQRPLFMHYEEEVESFDLQYSYLFGKDVLVKPIIQEHQTEQGVYLPNDEWVHLWSGKTYQGGETYTVQAPFGEPAVFYRKNSEFEDIFKEITIKLKKEKT